MASVKEESLPKDGSSAESPRLLSLNDSVIGSLTTNTDTTDTYKVRFVNDDTLVQVKFSVEQSINDYDYYYLSTPVGSFQIRPYYLSRIEDGQVVMSLPGGLNEYWTFRVGSPKNAMLKDSYSLEITEVEREEGTFYSNGLNGGRYSSLRNSDYYDPIVPTVPLNGRINGWETWGSANSSLKIDRLDKTSDFSANYYFYKFVIPEDESGSFTIDLDQSTNFYNAEYFELKIKVFNEANRSLAEASLSEGESFTINDLEQGTYYFTVTSTQVRGNYNGTGTYFGVNYILNTSFQNKQSDTEVQEGTEVGNSGADAPVTASQSEETPQTESSESGVSSGSQEPSSTNTDSVTEYPILTTTANGVQIITTSPGWFDISLDEAATLGTSETNKLDVIVNILGNVLMLKGLSEHLTPDSHTIDFNGVTFTYAEIDPFIMPIVRNGAFTDEFVQEIADVYPEHAGLSWSMASLIVGSALDEILIAIAGADGNYVG